MRRRSGKKSPADTDLYFKIAMGLLVEISNLRSFSSSLRTSQPNLQAFCQTFGPSIQQTLHPDLAAPFLADFDPGTKKGSWGFIKNPQDPLYLYGTEGET